MGMPSSTAGLLTIGEFSRLSQLSIRMLRYYDTNGVLAPALVDPVTGYRYYGGEQLEIAGRVRTLRDIGCPVSDIARLLPLFGSPAELTEALRIQRERLEGEASRIDARLREVDRLSAHLREVTMSIEIHEIDLPEITVAALRDRIPAYSDEGMLWERLMPLVEGSGATFPADGIAGATFLDPDYQDTNPDVEVWIQVAAPFAAVAPLNCRTEPAGRAVAATLVGDYSAMASVTSAIGAYIAEHGLRTGPMFAVYRVGPMQDPDPSAWITDVRFSIIEG